MREAVLNLRSAQSDALAQFQEWGNDKMNQLFEIDIDINIDTDFDFDLDDARDWIMDFVPDFDLDDVRQEIKQWLREKMSHLKRRHRRQHGRRGRRDHRGRPGRRPRRNRPERHQRRQWWDDDSDSSSDSSSDSDSDSDSDSSDSDSSDSDSSSSDDEPTFWSKKRGRGGRRHRGKGRKVNWLDWNNDDEGDQKWSKEWEWEPKEFHWREFKEDFLEKMRPTFEQAEPYFYALRDIIVNLKEKEAELAINFFTKLPLYLDERYTELCEGLPEDFTELNNLVDATPLQ